MISASVRQIVEAALGIPHITQLYIRNALSYFRSVHVRARQICNDCTLHSVICGTTAPEQHDGWPYFFYGWVFPNAA